MEIYSHLNPMGARSNSFIRIKEEAAVNCAIRTKMVGNIDLDLRTGPY